MTRRDNPHDMSRFGDAPPPQYPRRRIALLLLAAVVAVVTTFAGGGDDAYGPGDQAYRLALADSAPLDQASIHVYAEALDEADERCSQGRRQISGMTVLAVRRADVRGGEASHLGLLEALSQRAPAQAGGRADCAETLEAILQQRGF